MLGRTTVLPKGGICCHHCTWDLTKKGRFDKNFGLKVGLFDLEWLNRGLFVSYPVILGERLAGRQG